MGGGAAGGGGSFPLPDIDDLLGLGPAPGERRPPAVPIPAPAPAVVPAPAPAPAPAPPAQVQQPASGNARAFFGLEEEKKLKPVIPIDYDDHEKQAVLPPAAQSVAAAAQRINAMLAAPAPAPVVPAAGLGAAKAKQLQQKDLVDRIPKEKRALFAYKVNWDLVHKHDVVGSKLRPWVSKKITEYLGEEERTLIDFIVSQLMERAHPQSILDELALVLDEDAEIFTVKLWRMLIFHELRIAQGA
uniref:PWI domain-containing protein n=1 Tax=Fibrocapsa japonica TaxID=94617 RepID=A0A7S2XWQ2_9STRA|mmetsp:Transcript_20036/g.28964  ORF Transcript_20036/g.28964 Transcript_20036/m.28964 type:complete len:244 (+) Transcript_20036:3-734(+)